MSKEDLIAHWDAVKAEERARKAAVSGAPDAAKLQRLAEAARRAATPTVRIRYRDTEESGGVDVDPPDEDDEGPLGRG